MEWTVCPACGLKFAPRPGGCPRCAAGGGSPAGDSRKTKPVRWWRPFLIAVFVLLAYRTSLGVADIVDTGVADRFWAVFWGHR